MPIKRIQILFEFETESPRGRVQYRAVKTTTGGYRFEKKGIEADEFKAFMWASDVEGVAAHYRAIKNSLAWEKKQIKNHEKAESWALENGPDRR